MIRTPMRRLAAWFIVLLLVIPGWGFSFQGKSKQSEPTPKDQNQGQQKEAQPSGDKQKEKPKQEEQQPLFGGKLGLKSSHQTSDSASLGFNGIGPDGQVEKKFMDAAPTGEDQQKAQKVASYTVSEQELKAFLAEGDLNPKPGNQ